MTTELLNQAELKSIVRRDIGAQIRCARIARGFSIRGLAEQAGIGFSHITRIESGRYNVTIDTLAVIAAVLGKKLSLTDGIPTLL